MSAEDPKRMDHFTSATHNKLSALLEPSVVKLPRPFVVCIIAAAGAIGEAIALAYTRAGASGIVLTSRNVDSLAELAVTIVKINPRIKILNDECDLTRPKSVAALASNIKKVFGRLDVVALGQGWSGPVTTKVTEGDPAVFQDVTNVNYVGSYHAAHYLLPLLLQTKDGAQAFLVVGSIAACVVDGPIANTQYCISKLAQAKLVEHIAVQYGKEGLLALSIHPGSVATRGALDTSPEVFRECEQIRTSCYLNGNVDFLLDLVDDPGLCGGWCVALTKEKGKFDWLGGRMISANWDWVELMQKRDEIVERDLLKFRPAV